MRGLLFCGALLLCTIQVYSLEAPDSVFDDHILKCAEELNLDKQFVAKLMDDETFHLPKGNSKLHEALECVAKRKGVFKDDGGMDEQIVKTDIMKMAIPIMLKNKVDNEKVADQAIADCKDIKETGVGERIVALHNCFADSIRKHTK